MSQCFNEHASDEQRLNHNTVPVANCECTEELLYGEKVRVTEVPVLTCQCLWRAYQRQAEDIVAPEGVFIADPVKRNRIINSAYAQLWRLDNRFQWAGLAAFASKQVGCGLLHAAESHRENSEWNTRRRQRTRRSARKRGVGVFSAEERERRCEAAGVRAAAARIRTGRLAIIQCLS